MNLYLKTLNKVILIALLWIIAINPGRIYGDTNARLQMAHAWWTGTEEITLAPNYKPISRLDPTVGVLGKEGKRYIPYDVGQSLLMLPGDWLGDRLQKVFPKQDSEYLRRMVVNWLIFVPLNVATIVACFWLLRLFEFEERIAGLASITLLLGTTVLHYAHQNQQNHQVLLFVALAYATALACVRRGNFLLAMLSGLALGAALLIRQTSVIHGLTVFFFLMVCMVYKSFNKLQIIKVAGLWIVGFIPLVLVGRIFDYMRFGVFWTSGASLGVKQLHTDPIFSGLPNLPANFPFTNAPYVGILGALFSPAKSIFIYDPLLLPCLILGIAFWKRFSPYVQWYVVTCIFNLGLHIAFYSKLDFWHGDPAWGARYHLTSVHLLLIPLIAFSLQHLLSVKGLNRGLVVSFVALVITIQMTSIVLRPSAEVGRIYFAQPSSFLKFRLGERWTNIACLIDSSFASDCSRRLESTMYEPLIERVSLLPFNFTQSFKLGLILWGLWLICAIGATVKFYLAN